MEAEPGLKAQEGETQSQLYDRTVFIVVALGAAYFYVAFTPTCLLSGLPVLSLLTVYKLIMLGSEAYRDALLAAAGLHILYWLARPSWTLYVGFSIACWIATLVLALLQWSLLRIQLQPVIRMIKDKVARIESRVAKRSWPLLNINEHGYLAFPGGVTLDIIDGSIILTDVDFAYRVDELTTILAKLDTVKIRIGRDIALGQLSANLRGHGHTLESREPRVKHVSRIPTTASTDSLPGMVKTRSMPPAPPPELLKRPILLKKPSSNQVPGESGKMAPPQLPPRKATVATVVDDTSDTEDAQLQQAIRESLQGQHNSGNVSRVSFEEEPIKPARAPSGIDSELQSLYPQEEDAESDAYFRQVLEDNAVDHKVSLTLPIAPGDLDTKAAFANQLKDKLEETLRESEATPSAQIKLRKLLNRIPWWLKLAPGPLLTRLILSPLVWLHPVKIKSVAVSGTGKRITNLLERGGITRAHPDPEIFRLVRKVFLWLERGDVSIIFTEVQVTGYVPLARDPLVSAEIKATRPTAYRNTAGVEDLLAQMEAIAATVQLPTYLLPNHERFIPDTPRGLLFYSILASLPAVFNKELLIIGAAFLKATTMIDMKQESASRPSATLHLNGNFSLRGLGTSLKQAAGDLAKQKSVQWGVGSERLAKYVNKISKWMRTMRVDVGGKGEVAFDLIKLRRKRDSSGTASR